MRPSSKAFAGVTLFAFVLRLGFVLVVRPVPVSDFGWYYAHALSIAAGSGYTVHGYPTALWPPGWPYALAAASAVFGNSLLALEIVQAVLNALTAGVAFLIAQSLFGRACGIAAGLAYAALPSAVEWSATLASEPLYALLWGLAAYLWVSRSPRQLGWYALSGVLLGAAALVRPSALLYWIVPLVYAVLVRDERRRYAAWITAIGLSVLCMIAVISPVLIQEYRNFGTLVLISNNGGVSLYEGNNPQSSGTDSQLNDPRIQKLLDDPRTEVQGDRLANRLAVQYIMTHPRREILLALRRMKALYATDDSVIRFTLRSRHYHEAVSPPRSDRGAYALALFDTLYYYVLMIFAIAGLAACVRAYRPASDARWLLLLGLILYNTLIFSLITAVERYRYPTMPYFCVFAGLGMVAAWVYVQSRLRQRPALQRDTVAGEL